MYNVLIVVGLVMTVLATGCSSMQEGVKPVEVIEVEVLREVVEEEVVVEVPIFDNEDNIIGTELLKKEVDTVVEEVLL